MWGFEGLDYLFSIAFYTFDENVTAEEKEKLSKMTPEEIMNYESMLMINSDYEAPDILNVYHCIISTSDKEVCDYLNELGYNVDFAA